MDLIKLIVANFKLAVNKIMLFLLNQKIKKNRLKFLRSSYLLTYCFHKIYLKLRKIYNKI